MLRTSESIKFSQTCSTFWVAENAFNLPIFDFNFCAINIGNVAVDIVRPKK